MAKLEDKVALITGSSSGIGEGIARVFVDRGAKVMLTGRKEEALKRNATKFGGKAKYLAGDITDTAFQKALIDKTVEDFGKLDILVNNAGSFMNASLSEETDGAWDKLMKLNVTSPRNLTKLAIPHLKKSKGNVIQISSYAGLRPMMGGKANSYCASKAALDQFTQCFALEMADFGVRANSINPGFVNTPIFTKDFDASMNPGEDGAKMIKEYAQRVTPLGRLGSPEEIGYAAAFLASDDAAFITGAKLTVDGGLFCEHR